MEEGDEGGDKVTPGHLRPRDPSPGTPSRSVQKDKTKEVSDLGFLFLRPFLLLPLSVRTRLLILPEGTPPALPLSHRLDLVH